MEGRMDRVDTNQIFKFGKRVVERMTDPYYQGTAAELGFYFLFSMLPLLILLGQMMGLFAISRNVVAELAPLYVVPKFAQKLNQYLSYRPSWTLSPILLLFTLWAASQAHYSLIRISNYSYEHKLKGFGKSYVRERLRAIYTMMLMLFMIMFSLIILVYGEILAELAARYLHRFLNFDLQISNIWYLIRWPVGVAVMFPIICYNYHAIPYVKVPYRKVIPGSIFSSVSILLITWIYSIYAVKFSSNDLLYGSMATVMTLLFWFYLIGSILVIGIQVNIVWDEMISRDGPRRFETTVRL